ncbi:hypothetical protein AAMO2058_000926200 [Amorphochlora amoebiformis]
MMEGLLPPWLSLVLSLCVICVHSVQVFRMPGSVRNTSALTSTAANITTAPVDMCLYPVVEEKSSFQVTALAVQYLLGFKASQADGIFGPQTLRSVKRFQARNDQLDPTGVVDQDDWLELWDGATLYKGVRNTKEQVRAVQALLKHNTGAKIKPDGDFGKKTEKAVLSFQHRFYYPKNAIIDQRAFKGLLTLCEGPGRTISPKRPNLPITSTKSAPKAVKVATNTTSTAMPPITSETGKGACLEFRFPLFSSPFDVEIGGSLALSVQDFGNHEDVIYKLTGFVHLGASIDLAILRGSFAFRGQLTLEYQAPRITDTFNLIQFGLELLMQRQLMNTKVGRWLLSPNDDIQRFIDQFVKGVKRVEDRNDDVRALDLYTSYEEMFRNFNLGNSLVCPTATVMRRLHPKEKRWATFSATRERVGNSSSGIASKSPCPEVQGGDRAVTWRDYDIWGDAFYPRYVKKYPANKWYGECSPAKRRRRQRAGKPPLNTCRWKYSNLYREGILHANADANSTLEEKIERYTDVIIRQWSLSFFGTAVELSDSTHLYCRLRGWPRIDPDFYNRTRDYEYEDVPGTHQKWDSRNYRNKVQQEAMSRLCYFLKSGVLLPGGHRKNQSDFWWSTSKANENARNMIKLLTPWLFHQSEAEKKRFYEGSSSRIHSRIHRQVKAFTQGRGINGFLQMAEILSLSASEISTSLNKYMTRRVQSGSSSWKEMVGECRYGMKKAEIKGEFIVRGGASGMAVCFSNAGLQGKIGHLWTAKQRRTGRGSKDCMLSDWASQSWKYSGALTIQAAAGKPKLTIEYESDIAQRRDSSWKLQAIFPITRNSSSTFTPKFTRQKFRQMVVVELAERIRRVGQNGLRTATGGQGGYRRIRDFFIDFFGIVPATVRAVANNVVYQPFNSLFDTLFEYVGGQILKSPVGWVMGRMAPQGGTLNLRGGYYGLEMKISYDKNGGWGLDVHLLKGSTQSITLSGGRVGAGGYIYSTKKMEMVSLKFSD